MAAAEQAAAARTAAAKTKAEKAAAAAEKAAASSPGTRLQEPQFTAAMLYAGVTTVRASVEGVALLAYLPRMAAAVQAVDVLVQQFFKSNPEEHRVELQAAMLFSPLLTVVNHNLLNETVIQLLGLHGSVGTTTMEPLLVLGTALGWTRHSPGQPRTERMTVDELLRGLRDHAREPPPLTADMSYGGMLERVSTLHQITSLGGPAGGGVSGARVRGGGYPGVPEGGQGPDHEDGASAAGQVHSGPEAADRWLLLAEGPVGVPVSPAVGTATAGDPARGSDNAEEVEPAPRPSPRSLFLRR